MNTIGSNVPPPIPQLVLGPKEVLPMGGDPDEREPIPNLAVAIEAILRQPRRVMLQLRQDGAGRLIGMMLFGVLACSLVYGVVVGSFSLGTQLWAAPVKIALGLLTTGIICLPS